MLRIDSLFTTLELFSWDLSRTWVCADPSAGSPGSAWPCMRCQGAQRGALRRCEFASLTHAVGTSVPIL